jgi:hypothetical protein
LSALITRLTRRTAEDFARDRLFGPLRITDYIWPRDPLGQSYGGWGLRLKPRDTAKIGCLYLRHGRWEDQQLLPSQWIETVSHATVNTNLLGDRNLRYANQFWALPDKHIFMTVGYDCQVIMVLPNLDAIAVTTGRHSCPLGKLADAIAGGRQVGHRASCFARGRSKPGRSYPQDLDFGESGRVRRVREAVESATQYFCGMSFVGQSRPGRCETRSGYVRNTAHYAPAPIGRAVRHRLKQSQIPNPKPATRIVEGPKKLRPALGGELAARDPVWDGEGWGFDRVAYLRCLFDVSVRWQ